MVSADGFVKILDFGLAKLAPSAPAAFGSRAETLEGKTEAGMVLGTVGYMSPEQASGRPVDFRSDLFSFGAIVYELATGRRAFGRATAVETLSAILRDEPPPLASAAPGVPEPLSWVVARCLAKEPGERYASTKDLARDLAELRDRAETSRTALSPTGPKRRVGRAALLGAATLLLAGIALFWTARVRRLAPVPAAGDRSIAVLPLQNLGGRPEEEYFTDGMTESLITDLAKVKGLLVIARNSVFRYKGKPVDVKAVGKDLQVRYVLEGSVQRAGDSVRVNAQLIDAATGYHLWAEKYDRPMKDIFALQDDISGNIVRALNLALKPAAAPTANLEAYDAFLQGRFYLNQLEWKTKAGSVPLLERAVALDPNFALARATLASAYVRMAFEGDPGGRWTEKARLETEKTLSADPNLAEAYLARGNLAWTLKNGFPHEKAVADYRRALDLNPNLQPARKALAGVYYHVGLLDEAIEEYRKAARIDPRDLDALYRIPRIRLYQQKYAEALSGFEAAPEFRSDFLKPIVVAHLGRTNEALTLARSELTNPTHSKAVEQADVASTLAVVLALTGESAEAQEKIAVSAAKGKGNSHFHHAAYNIATAYALMGRKPDAVDWLEKTAREGMPCYPLFDRDPYLKGLRGDARFEALLARTRDQWEGLRGALK